MIVHLLGGWLTDCFALWLAHLWLMVDECMIFDERWEYGFRLDLAC